MTKFISFDMDGTLINTEFTDWVWKHGIPTLYGQKYGTSFEAAKILVEEEYQKVGEGAVEWYDIKYWFRFFQLETDWQDLMERYVDKIGVYPDVSPILEVLSHEFSLILASNAGREFIEIEMKATGLGINETGSGYDAANPYAGRDPRLAATVLFNGSVWKSIPLEVWNGGLNGPPKSHTTKTGYYLRKYLTESISLNPVNPGSGYHYWVIFRYAEVLLNYAEAMNEAYGPEVAGPAPLNNLTALQAVNQVRTRTGLAMPGFPTGMAADAFRTKLWNERRVELAFEDHRFWDLRRWKIGDQTTEIYGMDVVKDGTNFTYTRKLVETRVWDDKMYLYPIPQSEIFINGNLDQNEGW